MIVHCVIFHFARWHFSSIFFVISREIQIYFVFLLEKLWILAASDTVTPEPVVFFMQVCAHLAGRLAHLEAAWGLAA